MVKTGMNYFEIGITSGSKNSYAKCGWAITCEPSCQTAATSKAAGFNDLVSVNYSFNDERPETIRQTISYQTRAHLGADKVEPYFFIGLQPHTHLEEYAFKTA